MTPNPLNRQAFTTLVEYLGFPSGRLRDLRLEGRAAWLDVLPSLSPPERRTILLSLGDVLLCATTPGRRKWEHWREHETPLPPIPVDELLAWVRERVGYYGDQQLVDMVVSALTRAPEPVREHCIQYAAFLGVGLDSQAWTSSAWFVDREDRDKTRVVVLGPDVTERIVLHEIAHVWHHAGDGSGIAITAVGEAAVMALARTEDWRCADDAVGAVNELLAEACAIVWASA